MGGWDQQPETEVQRWERRTFRISLFGFYFGEQDGVIGPGIGAWVWMV